MATLTQKPFVGVDIRLTLNEQEARALAALAEIGPMVAALETVSPSFMKNHAYGFKEILIAAKRDIPPILTRLDNARDVFDGDKVAVDAPVEAES